MKKILLSVAVIAFVGTAIAGATGAFFSDTETSTGNTFTAGAIDLKIDNVQHYNGMVCVTDEQEVYTWVPSDFVSLDDDNHPYIEGNYDAGVWNDANPGAYPMAGEDCVGTWTLTDLTGEKFFSFDDVKPGDMGENTISIHVENNEAWACVAVSNVEQADNTQTEPESSVDTDGLDSGELGGVLNFFAWADDGDNIYEPGEDEVPFTQNPVSGNDIEDGVWAIADSSTGTPLDPNATAYVGVQWCAGDMTVDHNTGTITCDGTNVGNESQTDSMTADIEFTVVQSRNNLEFICGEGDE
ncbi:MAG: TasA family protein [Candidatus Paceibacterota bacterium]